MDSTKLFWPASTRRDRRAEMERADRYGYGQSASGRRESGGHDGIGWTLSLVAATPESHRELARFHAVTGKTWNNPVDLGRVASGCANATEMACYRITR